MSLCKIKAEKKVRIAKIQCNFLSLFEIKVAPRQFLSRMLPKKETVCLENLAHDRKSVTFYTLLPYLERISLHHSD